MLAAEPREGGRVDAGGILLDRDLAVSLAAQYPDMSSLDLQYNGIAALLDLRPLGALTELRLDHNDLTTLERVQGLSQVRLPLRIAASAEGGPWRDWKDRQRECGCGSVPRGSRGMQWRAAAKPYQPPRCHHGHLAYHSWH